VRDGNSDVFVMNADGSAPRNLSRHPGRDDYPVWMPDGRSVLAVSIRDGECDLFMFDVD
jgi:tricorn protease